MKRLFSKMNKGGETTETKSEPKQKKRLTTIDQIKKLFIQIINTVITEHKNELDIMKGNDTKAKNKIMDSYGAFDDEEDPDNEDDVRELLEKSIETGKDMIQKVEDARTVDKLFDLAFGKTKNLNPYIEEMHIDGSTSEVNTIIGLFLEDVKNDKDKHANYLDRVELSQKQIAEILLSNNTTSLNQ